MLGLSGNVGIDFRYNEDGIPKITEVNPRITQTLSLVQAGGMDLLYIQIKRLLGEALPSVKVDYGLKIKRRYLDQFYK